MIKVDDIMFCYIYNVYGLNIASEIPMPELVAVDKTEDLTIDVTISYGKVPREIEQAFSKGSYLKISKREFYFYAFRIAHYYVANGNRIIVEPEGQSDIQQLKVFLLGTCLGILLAQRNIIAIHGGAVVVDGQGIIITGHAGAGKSTLTSAFIKEGYSFLSDDVAALGRNQEGREIIYPTYPQQKLCRDVMERIGYDICKFSIIDPYREKYSVHSEMNFFHKPAPLSAIYEISIIENSTVDIMELFGSEKLKTFLKSIYRSEVISSVGFEPVYFKQCVELLRNVPVYRITRPKNSFMVKEQMELIKKQTKVSDLQIL